MARLALLFATACASCHVGAAEDTAALVQRSASAHKQTVVAKVLPADDVCACKPWKDVYDLHHSKHTNCTMGHELDISSDPDERKEHNPEFVYEWCLMFFGFLPNASFCINQKWEAHPRQWCYVDPECPRSDDPKHHGPFHVKYCDASLDRVSSTWPLQQVVNVSLDAKLNLLFLAQFAYPTANEMLDEIIPKIEEYKGLAIIPAREERMKPRLGKTWVLHGHDQHVFVLDCTGRTPADAPCPYPRDLCTLCELEKNESVGYGHREHIYKAANCRCIDILEG